MTPSCSQKIKAFNRDIEKLVQGEEIVKEKDTRLYNQLREEFKTWVLVLAANTNKGESWGSAARRAGLPCQGQKLLPMHRSA